MKKKLKYIGVIIILTNVFYILLLIFPNLLFANSYQYKNYHIYSDSYIPESIEKVLDDVSFRLSKSDLYKNKDQFSIYICNNQWRFNLFTRNKNAGGQVNFLISGNIFIRESSIEENSICPPGGWMYKTEERPLSYFIAHEAVHSLQRKISPFLVVNTETYILEGYADYIAKSPDFNFSKYLELYHNKDFSMDPGSGLYNKYHLAVAYLMDKKDYSIEQILSLQPDLGDVFLEMSEK